MLQKLRKFLRLAIGESMATVTGYRRPLGYQQLGNTALQSAVGFSLPKNPAGSLPGYAVIQCTGGVVRWRDDGVSPTATSSTTAAT